MTPTNPLILVEDDVDDQEMIKFALKDLGFNSEIKVFRDAEAALGFLQEPGIKPFLIISDINMPKMDGLRFKGAIEACGVLKQKSIPFVFLSTASFENFIAKAYELRAQGFFETGGTYLDLKESLNAILEYWRKSTHAN